MLNVFPSIISAEDLTSGGQDLPMMREVKFDFERGVPVFDRGQPVIVEGSEAVEVWVWHALRAERYRYEHESWRYGCEISRLRGRTYQQGTIESEARRYVTEALLACPYITSVEVTEMKSVEDTLHFTVRYTDIYGGGDAIHV